MFSSRQQICFCHFVVNHFPPKANQTKFWQHPTINDIHARFWWCFFDDFHKICSFDFSWQYLKSWKNVNVSYNQYVCCYEMMSKTYDDSHLLLSTNNSIMWNALFQSMYRFECLRLCVFIFWVFNVQFCKSSELLPDFHHRKYM